MIQKSTLERYLISSLTTFITAFSGVLVLQLSSGNGVGFTSAFFLSILTIAARAGIKAVVESFSGHADQPTV